MRTRRGSRPVAAVSVLLMLVSAGALAAALRAQHLAPAGEASQPAGSRARPGPATGADAQSRRDPLGTDARSRRVGEGDGGSVGEVRRWRAMLARLDRRRARAYAESAPRLLRHVYLPGSDALRVDRALLRRYGQRGLRVVGLRMRVVDLRVRARRGDRVVLLVRDRVDGGTVLGDAGRRRLSADRLDTEAITLRRLPGQGWRIGAVRPA